MRHCVQHTDRRVCVSCDDPTVGGTVMFLSVGYSVCLVDGDKQCVFNMFCFCSLKNKSDAWTSFQRIWGNSPQLVCSYAVYLETHLAIKNQTWIYVEYFTTRHQINSACFIYGWLKLILTTFYYWQCFNNPMNWLVFMSCAVQPLFLNGFWSFEDVTRL